MVSKLPLVVLSTMLIGSSICSAMLEDEKLPAFTYSGITGPERWGMLSPEYSTCQSGKWQSPVNIERGKVVISNNLGPLTRYYNPANSTLVNNGVSIGVHYEEEAGFIRINGNKFTLIQMHWHSPSEHRINGIQFPAELHLVHKADDGNLSVVAILFKYSSDHDPLLSQITDKMDELAEEVNQGNKETHVPLGTLDLKPLRRQTRKYYRYVGSLTTPPCSEKVIWNILAKVRCISKDQVEALKSPLESPYKSNARPCQPLNGRKIVLYNQRIKIHNNEDED